jgi:hypothetical protein
MTININKFRKQGDNKKEDNFGVVMPIQIFRLTWKNVDNEFFEFWSQNEIEAVNKKSKIDLDSQLEYLNFESWFAYRCDEHDKRFGYLEREHGWWDKKFK